MVKNQSLFLLRVIFVLVSLRFAYFNVFNLFLFFPTPNWHDNGKKPTEFSSKNNEHNEILRETFNCSITHCPCRFYWQTNSTFWIPIVHGSEFYRLDKTKEFFCSFINIMIVILKYFIFWVVVKTIKKNNWGNISVCVCFYRITNAVFLSPLDWNFYTFIFFR